MPSQTTTPRTEDVLSAAERLIGQLDDNAGAVRRLRLHGLTGRITGALPSPTSHTLGGLDSSAISLERSLDQGRASMGAMLCQLSVLAHWPLCLHCSISCKMDRLWMAHNKPLH